ncbi:MAG TPA: prenyltransferase/squalene oxidase repeat-containing protein [Thermomicrobiales bacterium]|nr:prenyltransferase/squalene oxidase repeat-containing protein [Thermomicrobiales bacterium]
MVATATAPAPGLLGAPGARPGIAGTAYDTAWLAGVPAPADPGLPRFPAALQWLVEHQRPDGSWGGAVRYEHDRVLGTLAALGSLAVFGRRAADHDAVARGTRYLWQRGHLLAGEPVEPVGCELLLPALVARARRAGVPVPPHLDIYGRERAEKLRLLPPDALYSPRVTVVHSLEFLGDEGDPAGLRAARGPNGSLGNSPAATAYYLAQSDDPAALAYLEGCLARTGGAMAPVLHPCETFELLWAAYHYALAGVPAARLLGPDERAALGAALRAGGVSLSPTFPIADADDTAVALLLLHDLGEPCDPRVLERFALGPGGCFASFPHERHASVGVNLHALHALARVPGYPDRERVMTRLLDYLAAEQRGGLYWLDKWHISPYYATAHALCILGALPPDLAARAAPLAARAREWVRQTQNGDGSWGFYGEPTAEETAYAVLALALARGAAGAPSPRDRRRCAAGARYLRRAAGAAGAGAEDYPPLWIDKCLYTPTLIVRATIAAALAATRGGRGRAAGAGGVEEAA